jgi:hypothetical protein
VTAAIAQASDGDIVRIPAGTATWSSTLSVSKSIALIGAGSGATILTNATGGTLIELAPASDKPVRLSGIRINSQDTYRYIVAARGPAANLRIDHCWFEKGDAIVTNALGGGGKGPVYGVIDHNTLHNMSRGYFVQDVESTDSAVAAAQGNPLGTDNSGATSWSRPIRPGNLDTVVLEDNQFLYDSGITAGNPDASIYGCYGGRAAIRHNVFSGYGVNYIDAHGDHPDWGVVLYEVYENTFNHGTAFEDVGDVANARGGMHIYFNNTFNGSTGFPLLLVHYFPQDIHVVTNTYFWGNTWDGKTDQASMIAPVDNQQFCSSCTVAQLNKDYFLRPPQSGDPFKYASFYPYTPLVYPHPLVE